MRARQTFVRKAAAALGYIDHDESLGPLFVRLPMTLEKHSRLVDELLRQGLTWKEIGSRLGVRSETLRHYRFKCRRRARAQAG